MTTDGLPEPFTAELTAPHPHRVHGSVVMTTGHTTTTLHPRLTVPAWGYGLDERSVTSPGPVLEIRAHERLHVRWRNRIGPPGPLPFAYVELDSALDDGNDTTQNHPGIGEATDRPTTSAPVGYLVTHLHGGHTVPDSDGWPEHMSGFDGEQPTRYDDDADNADLGLDKIGPMLWYHDHAMGATGLHVYAGLAGAYLVRDRREIHLGLPTGPADGEFVLMVADRNVTGPDDGPTRLLHKTTSGADPTREFFGPLTVVDGVLWPTLRVGTGVVRLRLLNGSNSRTYRLHAVVGDGVEGDRLLDAGRTLVIGTDGGLLWRAVAPDPAAGLTLAPAQRLDVLLDLRGMSGRHLTLVNSAGAPFDGSPAPADLVTPRPGDLIPHPQVMRLNIDGTAHCAATTDLWDRVRAVTLNPSYRRIVHDQTAPGPTEPPALELPEDHEHHVILLSESATPGHLQLTDLTPDTAGTIEVRLPTDPPADPPRRYSPVSSTFTGPVGVMPTLGRWQVWHFLNTTGDTHPMHIHQSTFQPLHDTATAYDVTGYSQETHSTSSPLVPKTDPAGRRYEAHETTGWQDTIRVDPEQLVSVAIRFDIPGRYVYHCHILEHEDNEMMKPFVVSPVPGGMPMPM